MILLAHEIQDLLARYEAAETSVAEERKLRDLLSRTDLPEEFLPYRQWFGGLYIIAEATSKRTDGPWLEQAFAKTPSASPLRVVHRRQPSRLLWQKQALAAAIVGLLALGVAMWLDKDLPQQDLIVEAQQDIPAPIDWSKYEVTDPEEAARITRAALVQVGTHLHRGSALTAEELSRMQPIHLILNRKS